MTPRASTSPTKDLKLDFTELTQELKEIVDNVLDVKSKGKNLNRDTIYDPNL